MPIDILMPALSPTMTSGTLANWLKKEGDKIKAGDVLAEIETDKATMEVESIDEGILAKIIVQAGTEDVAVNSLIAVILEEGEDASALEAHLANKGSLAAANSTNSSASTTQVIESRTSTEAIIHPHSACHSKIIASPLAKRIAQQENIDLHKVKGTGPHGRIIKDDVIEAKAAGNISSPSISTNIGRNTEAYTLQANNNMRKTIAKRLVESKQTVPHFYLNIECELDKLMKVREEMNAATSKDNPAYKLSVNDFIIKASAMALKKVPEANASWTDSHIMYFNNVDISVAVAIDGGLITPIIKNADQKSISVISNEMKDLAARAKGGKLMPEEYQGGGFSISNVGMFGIKRFNAIINPPQSCIIAVGAGSERAVVKNGQLTVATVMDVTLSCDHRVVDGAVGAKFLEAFKQFVENPVLMFV